MRKNKKGFGVVEIILIIVVIGLIVAASWLFLDSRKSSTGDKETNTGNSQQTTNNDEAKTPEGTKPDPNAGYLVLKDWGLRFKIPSGLSDVQYRIYGDRVIFFAKPTGFNVQYRADYDESEDSSSRYATGNLYRSTDSTKLNLDYTVQGKKVGDYYYYTSWAFSGLASGVGYSGLYGDDLDDVNIQAEGTAFRLVNQGDTALLNTIELAQ